MCGAIDGSHAATAQTFIQPVFTVEDPTQKWIDGNISYRGVRLQRRVIKWTDCFIVRELPATSWALEHRWLTKFSERAAFIIAQT
jgi:hypothetical protein